MAAEYKARCLQAASLAGATLAKIITRAVPPNLALDRFTTIRKAHFHLDQETKLEIDLPAVSEPLMVMVKRALAGHIERKTTFLLYSESGLGEELAATLA